ncbi:methyltransferase domain-containing protein [Streptomyces sp. NPDC006798]|uniref:methyltransferase domain-containing protein n=1 Tax=Streptomyces sp. NPDC006798 TaxID=3155462 RepID=UPI003407CD71
MIQDHFDVARPHLTSMVEALRAARAIRTEPWVEAFSAVPRHPFVPRWYEMGSADDGISVWRMVDADDERRLALVYRDETLVTALDPATAERVGEHTWTGIPTSSSTLPSVLAGMLEDLDVEDGDRALHIGTGTGYLVALLCARLGEKSVFSIDIDPATVDSAREHLAQVGYEPRLTFGDGRKGYPDAGPFDRIIATCSLPGLSDELMTDTRPGTVIVTDIGLGIEGGVVRLVVDGNGRASGRFTTAGGRFMPARSGAATYSPAEPLDYAPEAATRTTGVTGLDLRSNYAFRLLLAAELRETEFVYHSDERTGTVSIQLQRPDGSWARSPIAGEPTVTFGGTPSLWRRVEHLWAWWTENGRPEHDRFAYVREPDGSAYVAHHDSGRRWPL